MKLILLGTGNPIPNPKRAGPSQVMLVDSEPIVIDCGSGVVTQLVKAGINPADVRYVFLTHHHYDHNIDYAHFVLAGWTMGRKHILEVYGPKETARITSLLFNHVFQTDIVARNYIRVPGRPSDVMVRAVDIDENFALKKRGWKITAIKVDHPQVKHTLGFRIDAKAKSLVFSADTAPCKELIEKAKGADVLVHEVMTSARAELHIGHTLPGQLGLVAREAQVKTLVLSHLEKELEPERTVAEIKRFFKGKVIVGEDLMEIKI